MSIETKCFCDMCGAVRGATNHWFMVGSLPGAIVVKRWESSKFASAQIHLCGQKCVHALLDRWLTTGSLDANLGGVPRRQRAKIPHIREAWADLLPPGFGRHKVVGQLVRDLAPVYQDAVGV